MQRVEAGFFESAFPAERRERMLCFEKQLSACMGFCPGKRKTQPPTHKIKKSVTQTCMCKKKKSQHKNNQRGAHTHTHTQTWMSHHKMCTVLLMCVLQWTIETKIEKAHYVIRLWEGTHEVHWLVWPTSTPSQTGFKSNLCRAAVYLYI